MWLWLLVPVLGCGGGWFFGLGCFLVAVGMGGVGFLSVGYVGCMLVGWDEDGRACWTVSGSSRSEYMFYKRLLADWATV